MCQHVQHVYHGFLIYYKYVRDFQQCVIKSIRVVSLHFVSFCYKSILVGRPLTSYINIYFFIYYIYINSFIIPKTSYNSYDFYSGWLLSQNLGILNIQMEKRGIYGRKSANVRFPCTCLWRHLDRKSKVLCCGRI